MGRLYKDTQAIQIHGKTGQQIGYVTLPEGTRYGRVALSYDVLGFAWKTIEVKGYRYQILESGGQR